MIGVTPKPLTLRALDASAELTMPELHAALANALQRVAELEHERDQLGELLKVFNEMVDASRLHGPGFLDTQ